jgi:hypothetical protein
LTKKIGHIDGKKIMVKTSVSRLVCPKWHFGQVGQGSKRSKGLSLLIV